MNNEIHERLDAISEALARMIRRQGQIEARLDQIERALQVKAPAAVEMPMITSVEAAQPTSDLITESHESTISQPPLEPESFAAGPSDGPPPLPQAEHQPRYAAASNEIPTSAEAALETRFGLNWLNRIAVVTLILGTGFFFKFAVDNEWIGPGARVALGVAAGMISLSIGEWMSIRKQLVFARGMTGLGLALLYLSFYASFGFYELLPQSVAFLLMAVTTVAAGGLALHYNSLAVATLGLLGGYLTPGLLSTGENRPWSLFGYLFLINTGTLAIRRLRKWNSPEYIAFIASCLYFSGWYRQWFGDDMHLVATVALIAFYAQFLVAGSRILSQAGQFLTAMGVLTMWPNPAQGFPLLFLIAISGLAASEWRKWKETPLLTAAGFWFAIWLVWRYEIWTGQPGLVFAWFTIGFLALYAWLPWWLVIQKREARSSEFWLLAVNPAAYFVASYELLDRSHHDSMGVFSVALAAIHIFSAKAFWKPGEARESYLSQISAGIAMAFLTLAIPIQFAGFRITVAWALEAAVCTWLARKLKNTRLPYATAGLLLLVLLRLMVFDEGVHTDQFFNERLLTFAVTAASFLYAALCFGQPLMAAATYCMGHVILLFGLGLEVAGWAERTATDVGSVSSTGISILMAVYAFVLVGVGVAIRSRLNRILGLALFGTVIVKLYLIDVWALRRGFRITAFMVLGALLLLVSYLYSRFKPMFEKWWKETTPGETAPLPPN